MAKNGDFFGVDGQLDGQSGRSFFVGNWTVKTLAKCVAWGYRNEPQKGIFEESGTFGATFERGNICRKPLFMGLPVVF